MSEPNDKLKLAKETIRLLLDVLKMPVSETNYVDRMEAIEAGEIVYAGL